MMSAQKEKTKKSISNAFKVKDYDPAFKQLLVLQHHEVAKLLSKNKWLDDPSISSYFWMKFCPENLAFVFDSASAESILNCYLKDLSQTNDELNKLLIKDYPALFVRAIKRNRAFLDEVFLEKIKKNDWSPEFSIELLAWIELQKRFQFHQHAIDDVWNKISPMNYESILCNIVHWMDVQFYEEFSTENHEKLRRIYNFALSFIFSKKVSEKPVSEEDFNTQFAKTIAITGVNHVEIFLKKIEIWIHFEATTLCSYCFDDNFKASMKDGILFFGFEFEEVYHQWHLDTKRYLVNCKRYQATAIQIYNYQDENGELTIPTGGSTVDEDINHYLYVKNWQAVLFLGDLYIRNIQFEGSSVHISKLLSGLMSYSINRKNRYQEVMCKWIDDGHTWIESLQMNMMKANHEGITNAPMPYIYDSIEEFTEIYLNAIPELNKEEILDLINHFSHIPKTDANFDPFHIRFHVLETPFLRIGDFIFASTSFFATNDWFYSIAQRALTLYGNHNHSKERNETAAEMETGLGEEFRKHGWKVKVISQKEANQLDGDIDLFVNDGNTQVLIQLKRTKLKLDLASDYKDSLETDLNASGQLNEAVHSLNHHPKPGMEILENHHKWIVSTSFEGVLSTKEACLKVNYFDLLWALNRDKFENLDAFISFIEADQPFLLCEDLLDLLP